MTPACPSLDCGWLRRSGAGRSSLLRQYAWQGRAARGVTTTRLCCEEKRAGCGNANFLRKKAVLPGCSAAKRCARSDNTMPHCSRSQGDCQGLPQNNPAKRKGHASAREQGHKINAVAGIIAPSSAALRTVYIHPLLQIKYFHVRPERIGRSVFYDQMSASGAVVMSAAS